MTTRMTLLLSLPLHEVRQEAALSQECPLDSLVWLEWEDPVEWTSRA